MAETFRAPKSVQSEVTENRGLAAAEKIQSALSLEDVIEIRQSWQGENGREWANRISASVEERAAQLTKGSTTMSEIRDGIYGADAYGVPHSILAADASIDAAQDLLQQIMNDDPVAAQAFHLLVAADLALDPVIKAMGLSDPDEDEADGEENSAAILDQETTDDPATKMLPRSATGAAGLPLAPRDTTWDASEADKRVQEYAGGKDDMDWAKYGKAFFYVDESDKEKLGSYKLQFADVIDGELKAVPKGIFAVAGVLNGARGGVDIPEADQDAIKSKVEDYYLAMAKEFDDEDIKAPFEGRAAAARIGEGTYVSWPTSKGRARGKVEKVMTRGTATSSDGYSIEGTADNPAFHVRVYREQGNGWVASDQVNVHRANYLTIIKPLQSPRSADISMVEERKAAIRTAERITMTTELRAVGQDDENFKIAGYAATFNSEATGLNFREMIAPGAFTRTLQSDNPVFFLINHDTESLPLASTQSGTLRLSEDSTGLRMEADLDMKNPRAQELASAIERGDVNKMSFAFSVADGGQTKEDGLRTLTDLDLFEVSAVTWPAYDSTTLSPRSADAALDAEDIEIRKRQLAAKFNQYSLRHKR